MNMQRSSLRVADWVAKVPKAFRTFKKTSALVAGASVACLSRTAHADTTCGSTSAGWNVPNGATVFEVAPGIISDVLVAEGESRSHSMLSHGPNTWVTHSTSTTPGYVENCHNPVDVNFMGASTPGLTTIDQGAAYTFLYLNGGGPTDLWYQNATDLSDSAGNQVQTGPMVGNTFLGSDEYGDQWQWTSTGSGSDLVWGMDFAVNDGAAFATKGQIYYGWYQYMNVGETPHGYPAAQTGAPQSRGYGVTCSSSLAMWQHDALWNSPAYSGDVLPRTYGSTSITAAANTLFADVYNRCKGTTNLDDGGSFGVAAWAGGACIGISVCSNAANQIVNAFASPGGFIDDVGDWGSVVARSSAVSISPDDIACWNGNGTGAPCTGAGASIWGWDINHSVQWNSGGNTYGCW
jgi:hypothetical protein